jgi:hypothetical protein
MISCRFYRPDFDKRCKPLDAQKVVYVVPFVTELGRQHSEGHVESAWERAQGWAPASEIRMNSLDRIKLWADNISKDSDVVVKVDTHASLADFDSTHPREFIRKYWEFLEVYNVVASHSRVLDALMKQCDSSFDESVPNGSVVKTVWRQNREEKVVFFVRHCLSCANYLHKYRGARATQCMTLDSIYSARCILHSLIPNGQRILVFASSQPRAMQTAVALLTDNLELKSYPHLYTDCDEMREL